MKTICRSAFEFIHQVERVATILAFAIILIAAIVSVAGRELVGHGVLGASSVAVYAMIVCVMACFGLATTAGSHLRPKFLDWCIPNSLEPTVRRLGFLTSSAILFAVGYFSCRFVAFSFEIEERDLALGWLIWPIQAVLPIAFLLSAVRYFGYAIWPDIAPPDRLQAP